MNGDGNNKHDNDFVGAADFLVHFAAVAFAYIELYPPPPPPGQNGGVDAISIDAFSMTTKTH